MLQPQQVCASRQGPAAQHAGLITPHRQSIWNFIPVYTLLSHPTRPVVRLPRHPAKTHAQPPTWIMSLIMPPMSMFWNSPALAALSSLSSTWGSPGSRLRACTAAGRGGGGCWLG